jgi:hypothetical protein
MPSSITPNVVVQNPMVRRWAQIILSIVGLTLSSIMVLDNSIPSADWSAFTVPAFALYGFLAATFGIAVITPNIPTNGHVSRTEEVVETIVVKPAPVVQEDEGPRG